MTEPSLKKSKCVPFHILMADGSMRNVEIPYVPNQIIKDAQDVAIGMLSKEDQELINGQTPRWFYKRCDVDILSIMDEMREKKVDTMDFIEVDTETHNPIAQYTITRTAL